MNDMQFSLSVISKKISLWPIVCWVYTSVVAHKTIRE